jgi:hypothetical protein
MAYDAASGQVVLYGGYGTNSTLGDTWTWNGSTWTKLSAVISGTPFYEAAMAYDAASGQVVLFGGLSGQVTALAGTWTLQLGAVNMGTANVCPAGTTAPTPCSQSGTLSYSVAADTIIGSIHILTQGAQFLDFQAPGGAVGATACTAKTYSSATTCTVDVTFAPTYAGLRNGAVVMEDNTGHVLATTYLYGTGTAPQVAFTPGTMNPIAGTGTAGWGNASTGFFDELNMPQGVAVDSAGNSYIADTANSVIQKVSPTETITIVTGDGTPGYSGDGGAAANAEVEQPQGGGGRRRG